MKRAGRPVKSQLVGLKNIGPTIARRLMAVGIHSRDDLRRIGPALAYSKMQAQTADNLPVCFYLYSLEGALTDRHWDDLPEATKAFLLEAVGRA
jgi:DNA transformation protein and related proteins